MNRACPFLDEAAADNLYCLWQPTVALNMDERCAGLDMLEARGRLLNLHVYYWLEGKRRPFAEGLDEWRRYLQHVNRNEKTLRSAGICVEQHRGAVSGRRRSMEAAFAGNGDELKRRKAKWQIYM